MDEYLIDVTFCGYIGTDQQYTEYADSEEDAIDQALDEAKDDLEVTDVVDNGDGTYDVQVNFAGYIGVDNTYVVDADDEDEAAELALEDAYMDLEGEVVSEDMD